MPTVVVTGADGFIGRNLCAYLEPKADWQLLRVTRNDSLESLKDKLAQADVVYHLAGINRPQNEVEFERGNYDFTETMLDVLESSGKAPTVVFTSSTQVMRDNPYGQSKRRAEEALTRFAERSGGRRVIYRLPNVFGKWSRPNYNSVVATFCHNIARDLPVRVDDPTTELTLVYIDDVVESFLRHLEKHDETSDFAEVPQRYSTSLGRLAETLRSFRTGRETLYLPDFTDPLTKRLYTTYLSYLPKDSFSYLPLMREDARGSLTELLKGEALGQIFVSTTRPGITRGHHYHHSKVEKFCVVRGAAVIRFRALDDSEVLFYSVSGERVEIVDIPPGYTHSIENVGDGDMVVLFWANEPFNPESPDSYMLEV